MAMAPPKPFVFMHYSNPAEDSKRLENRQKVAKYAMLGRQKNNTTQASKSQASQRSQSQQQQQQQQQQSRASTSPKSVGTPSTNGSWDQDQHQSRDNLHTYPDSLPSLSESASSVASNYSGSPPTISPAFWPVSLNNNDGHFPTDPIATRHDSGFDPKVLQRDNASDFASADQYYGSTSPKEVAVPKSKAGSRHESMSSHGDESRIALRRRQGKKRHEQAKLARADSGKTIELDEEDCTSVLVPHRLAHGEFLFNPHQGPRNLLSASGSRADPFSCLPIKANAHTHELLYQYMNARLISGVFANGSPEIFNRIKQMRHTVWGPLTMKSKAALNALVAYVESTPGLPIRSRSKDFLFSHVQAALEAIREALSKPDVATDDSICLAVVLLMLTAQREGSTSTYAQHAAGLATLLSFRTQAIHKLGEQHDTVARLRSFYMKDPNDECNYCRTNGSPSRNPTPQPFQEAFICDAQTFNEDYYPRGEGFRDLVRQELLSHSMKAFIEPAMIWSTLAERARRDKLSAAIGATHAWIDEGEFSLDNMANPLDTAVYTTVRLTFYLSSWLDWQHTCYAVRRMVDAIYTALLETDIDMLLIRAPQLLIWLCLIIGPLCEGPNRLWFLALLDRAKRTLNLDPMDFHGRIELFTHTYVWSATMTPLAQNFWDEANYGSPDAYPPINSFEDSFGDSYQTGTITEVW